MASEYAPGRMVAVVVALIVIELVGIVIGVVGSFGGTNPLFVDSAVAVPALVTILVVFGTLGAVVLAGRPSQEWQRTPYW